MNPLTKWNPWRHETESGALWGRDLEEKSRFTRHRDGKSVGGDKAKHASPRTLGSRLRHSRPLPKAPKTEVRASRDS